MLVCDVTACDDDELVLALEPLVELVVVVVADVELPDPLDDEALVLLLVLELAAAVCVAVARPSRQAKMPPSESIDATLSAAAALRARAARGRRRPSVAARRRSGGTVAREGVVSSMRTTVRTGREGCSRAG